MKRVLLSLMIVGVLAIAVPASAHTANTTRRWGEPKYVKLWSAQGGRLLAKHTLATNKMVYAFKNSSSHTINFFCVWHEKVGNGVLQRRQWRGSVTPRRGEVTRGPHATRFYPTDATCTLS
jgi:hypothetical protein